MARILLIGGAGYVGSSVTAFLKDQGHFVWVVDDLSRGHKELLLGDGFTKARAGDKKTIQELHKKHQFDGVMHFAAFAQVGESVQFPDLYQENNVDQTRDLLDAMCEVGLKRFVFSSTCAVFGDPGTQNISENLPKKPINPYGETKLEVERILEKSVNSHGLKSIALRYFNAAGCERGLRVGEWHEPETHLIPNILKTVFQGGTVSVLGNQYPTPDGTCIRDYVHVTDLARAHEAALLKLISDQTPVGSFDSFNLGSGDGYSVLDVIKAAEKVLGRSVPYKIKDPRPGDPPRLVADSKKARSELGFTIQENALEKIIESAWAWDIKLQALKGAYQNRAVFFDRDGTLNIDPGYLNDPEKVELLPTVGEALAKLHAAGFKLVVVTNQSGVARGLVEPKNLEKIHFKLDALLQKFGAKLDGYQICLHHPDENCACRKPKPKLILDACLDLKVDLRQSYFVGDRASDIGAAKNAGCKAAALVLTGHSQAGESGEQSARADFVGSFLLEIADWILKKP